MTNTLTSADVTAALDAYRKAEMDLLEFRAEYGPLLQLHAELEQGVRDAKAAVLAALEGLGIDYGGSDDFHAEVRRADRGSYDVTLLPRTKDVLDCCELSINKDAVKRLVKRGVLSQDEADAAYVPRPAAPYVVITPKRDEP